MFEFLPLSNIYQWVLVLVLGLVLVVMLLLEVVVIVVVLLVVGFGGYQIKHYQHNH